MKYNLRDIAQVKRFKLNWAFWGLVVVFYLPNVYSYLIFRFSWHDVGHLYRILDNLFLKGEFYSMDWRMNHFNIHFTPIFYLIAPVVHLIHSSLWFAFIVTLPLAGSGMLIYLITEHVTQHKIVAWGALAAFLLNPYVWSMNLYPHFEVFGVFFLLLMAWAMLHEKAGLAVVSLVLALTVKQDFWIYALFLICGFYIKKNNKLCGLLISICLLYYLVVLKLFYPHYFPKHYDRTPEFWAYGNTQSEVLKYLVTHPVFVLSHLLSPTVYIILGSLGFLNLWTWRIFLILPPLLLWLCSTTPERAQFDFYYIYPILPSLFAFLPYSLRNLLNASFTKKIYKIIQNVIKIDMPRFLAVMLVVSSFWVHVATYKSRAVHLGQLHAKEFLSSRTWKLHRILNKLDTSRSIYTQFSLGAYVIDHKTIYLSHIAAQNLIRKKIRPEIILLDIKRDLYASVHPKKVYEAVKNNPEYELVESFDGIYLFMLRS